MKDIFLGLLTLLFFLGLMFNIGSCCLRVCRYIYWEEDGVFGISLGEVPEIKHRLYNYDSFDGCFWEKIEPPKPSDLFDNYCVSLFPENNRVYRITATATFCVYGEYEHTSFQARSRFDEIAAILDRKYGPAVTIGEDLRRYEDSTRIFGLTLSKYPSQESIPQYPFYSAKKEDQLVRLSVTSKKMLNMLPKAVREWQKRLKKDREAAQDKIF